MKYIITFLFLFTVSYTVSAQGIDYDAIQAEFTADTARVEQQTRTMLDKDYSTVAMINSTNYMEEEYDKLLNKYYKILYNALDEEGKQALKQTQRNWIKLRDSDKVLISAMRAQAYKEAGGGTVWGVVSASARANITRDRVFQLYSFLQFSDLGGR